MNQRPRTQFVFFRSFRRWLTDVCLFEGGFVVLCHGCDECWSCYFYPKWRVSETRPKLALGLPVEGIISYCVCVGWHGFTKEQHTKTNIWIFGSLMFLSFYICSTTEQYSKKDIKSSSGSSEDQKSFSFYTCSTKEYYKKDIVELSYSFSTYTRNNIKKKSNLPLDLWKIKNLFLLLNFHTRFLRTRHHVVS